MHWLKIMDNVSENKRHNTKMFFSSTKGIKDVNIIIFYETDFELRCPSWT